MVRLGAFLAALPRAMVPTTVEIVVSGCERSVTGARIDLNAIVSALIVVRRRFVRRWAAERRGDGYTMVLGVMEVIYVGMEELLQDERWL